MDSGPMLRALELALGRAPDPAHANPVGTLADLAHELDRRDWVARLRRLSVAGVRAAAATGSSVLLRGAGGDWVVAAGRRATWIRAGDERRIRLTEAALRRAGADPDAAQAVVVEPRLGLRSLSRWTRSKITAWGRLRALMWLERRELWSLAAYAVALGGLSLAVPIAVQVLVNTIAFGSLLQPLLVLAALLLGVLTVSGGIQLLQWYAVEVLQRRLFVRVAEDFARRLPRVAYETNEDTDVREVANRFFEVVSLQKTASRLLLDGLGLVLQTTVGMLLLAFYHPVLLAFDVVLVAALAVVIGLGYGAVPTAIAESRAKYRVAAWLQTVAGNPVTFKADAAARFAAVRADALTRSYLQARRRHYRRVLRQLVGGVGVQVAAMVALLGLGGWLVMQGELTLGQLVAAELVVGVVSAGFAKLGKHLEAGYDLLASLDKVGKVLDLPLEGDEIHPHGVDPTPCHLILSGVVGGLRASAWSGRVPAGGRVRLAGEGQAGTTILLETLAGLRRPVVGTIEIGGAVTSRAQRRSRTLLTRPGDLLHDGTVMDNLRVADPGLDPPRAWAALRAVGLEAVVAQRATGLDTPVTALSAARADAARLSLARAFVKRPDVLLIDGTLDQIGEIQGEAAALVDAVLGPDAPWTAVVATSRPEVAQRCEVRLIPQEATES